MADYIIKTIATPNGKYVYDRNTHTVIALDDKSYDDIRAMELGELGEQDCVSLQKLHAMGILNPNIVKEIRHPDTDYLEHYINCRIRQVVLQVTQQCNLRCDYCVYSGNYFTREHSNKKMTMETAFKAINYALEHSSEANEVCFSFYGGEPLLELELIKECVAYVKKHMTGRKYRFSMTTNGTLLTPETLKFLVKNKFMLSISLDGPQKEHNSNRKFRNGKGSFETIINNIKYIKDNYNEFWESLNFMITLNPKVNLDEVTSFFDNSEVIPRRLMQFNEVESTNLKNTEWLNYGEQYYLSMKFKYLKVLMALANMIEDKNIDKIFEIIYTRKKIFISDLKKGKRLQPCTHHGGPCVPGMKKIFVSVDGTYYPCEKVVENSATLSIGSIGDGLCVESMNRILNLGWLTKEQCMECWALQNCGLCVAQIEGNDGEKFITTKEKLKACQNKKDEFERLLYEYCVLNECRSVEVEG